MDDSGGDDPDNPEGKTNKRRRVFRVYVYDDAPREPLDTGWREPATSSDSPWNNLQRALIEDYDLLQATLASSKIDPYYDDDYQGVESFEDICERKVIEPLRSIGFDLAKFRNYLALGSDFRNGNESRLKFNDVFGPNLGVVDPKLTVQEFFLFAKSPKTGKPIANVLTSYPLSQKRLTIFANPNTAQSSPALLFHEALHGYGAYLNNGNPGAYSDYPLMNLFGLTGSTDAITDYINQYCGDYFDGR